MPVQQTAPASGPSHYTTTNVHEKGVDEADLVKTDGKYVYTLRAWYHRFKANHDEVVRLADERFYRLYAFYLAASSTMFSDGGMCVYQLQYLRSRYAAPMTRNYMIETEQRYRELPADPARS